MAAPCSSPTRTTPTAAAPSFRRRAPGRGRQRLRHRQLNASSGTINLNGFNQTAHHHQGTAPITNSCTTAAVLTDAISSTQTYSGNITGNLSLAVTGTGNQTLTGNNTYTGNTTVSGGATLGLNGAGKLTNSPNVFVSGGGTLLLDNTATNTATRLPSTANLTLDGGTFQLNGCSTTGNATQTLGNLTLSGGSPVSR